jgi:hypothetical protein
MFGSQILEVAIGVIFVFLLVSIMCSAMREGIEAWRRSRAAYLEHGIRELLHDTGGAGLARDLYQHPLISGLYGGSYVEGRRATEPSLLAKGGNLPSYIPTRNFALALMDMAARGPLTDVVSGDPDAPALTLENMRRNVAGLRSPPVQRVVLTAIDAAQGNIDNARAAIERWYDSAMDRVSGQYKRSTSWVIFWVGLAVAVALNVNAITLADYLYRNDSARKVLVARAQTAVADTGYLERSYRDAKATLDSANLPIGWSNGWGAPQPRGDRVGFEPWADLLAPVLGLLLTALAATFGAPFWFDLLNKVMVVRSTVKPHEKSGEESSEDRQKPKDKSLATPTDDIAAPIIAPVVVGAAVPLAVPPAAPVRTTSALASRAPERPPSPRDKDSAEDGCDVEMAEVAVVTSDEDLPEAEGGVA